ncbi:MAG: hypothetical protein GY857_10850 [Desulfobacula sp.]|nr:hypothetical protein [Desulfobacula sp.]
MSSISNQPLMAEASPWQNYPSDAQFSNYVKKQSISAYESLDAGLTIETKEGDLVTLTSSSYTQLDAHMYDSRGIVQTESGRAMVTQNTREITLVSGESFSFSVVGDLNEAELADIESIVKSIDEIIDEMVQGDMDGAVDRALSMGGYDTVSMYAADLSHAKSYQMTSQMTSQTMESIPEPKPEMLLEEENPAAFANKSFPENFTPGNHKKSAIKNINKFVEKMTEQLAEHEDKLVDKAQKPIDKLFRHHLGDIRQKSEDKNAEKQSIYTAIDDIRQKIDQFIDQMTKDLFKDNIETLLE